MAPAVVTVHSPSSNAGSADASKIAVQRRLLKASNEDATLLNGASAGEQEHGSTPPPGKTKASESETNGAPGPERQSDVAAESKLPEESKDGATDNQKHSSAEGEKADGSVYSDDPDDPDDPDGLDDEDLDDDDVKIEDVELVENAPKRWTKKLTERRKRRLEMFSKWYVCREISFKGSRMVGGKRKRKRLRLRQPRRLVKLTKRSSLRKHSLRPTATSYQTPESTSWSYLKLQR